MTDIEVLRLLGEVISILVALAGGVWWLARQVTKVYEMAEKGYDTGVANGARLDKLNGTVTELKETDQTHALAIAHLQGKEEGRAEMVQAANAAAKLIGPEKGAT